MGELDELVELHRAGASLSFMAQSVDLDHCYYYHSARRLSFTRTDEEVSTRSSYFLNEEIVGRYHSITRHLLKFMPVAFETKSFIRSPSDTNVGKLRTKSHNHIRIHARLR